MVFGRLYRLIPMHILLAAIVAIVYLRMRNYSIPLKTKDFLIRALSWFFSTTSIVGIVAVIYALLDKNTFAAELFGNSVLIFIVSWIIMRIWATATPVKVVRHIRRDKWL